ncbi:AraC-like DNA-binding protein [Ruminococcaceae bacterium R-25]|nr:AraC-like DNA-binding protein [Ruminococcaceae bacterium R-25]SUQ11401.1 AraC-type DNA-binding protein [Oscillospiraceae bacterium]
MDKFFTNNKSKIVDSDRVLYTASPFARSSLFHLQEIGRLEALKPHVSSRSDLQSYLFIIVEKGSGMLKYNGREYELTKGSCVFIDCHKPYSHQPDPDDLWALSWCHFYGPTLASIYNKYCERGGRPSFEPSDTRPFADVLGDLISLSKSSEHMRDMLINEKLSTLLRLIMAESWHPEDKALPVKKASVLEVKTYLDENYESKISLDSLCAKFFISKHYLTHSFKEQFGMTITSYLLSVRITHAKQLLRFTNKSVEEIGYEVGIGAPHYFSRVFKEVEGVSPTVYREQW